MNIKTIFKSSLIIITSIIILHIVNYIVERLVIIGDPCKFDKSDNELSATFKLFYTISSNTGYHPEPSLLNFSLTTLIGFILGIFISYKTLKKTNIKS